MVTCAGTCRRNTWVRWDEKKRMLLGHTLCNVGRKMYDETKKSELGPNVLWDLQKGNHALERWDDKCMRAAGAKTGTWGEK